MAISGGCIINLKDFEKALEYATRGYETSKKAGLKVAEGMFQMQMGISHLEMEDYVNALPLLNKSVDFYLERFHPYNLQMGYVNLGKLYYKADTLDKSEDMLLKAIQLGDSIDVLAGNSSAHALLAHIARKRNQFEKSCCFCTQVIGDRPGKQTFN